ncbi:MAG: hypothetical protein CL878_11375 [Dehalococcoidia bacterium]|nr:hypothetical protein [Dehalococcoidia bacterium]
MQVNPQQLLDDGFIILRQVIPPERLDELRTSYETIVKRQHQIWSGELEWDEPVGMDYKPKQPRIVLSAVVDAATADTVEFCLHENTLGVSRQLMRAPEASPVGMFLMCNPETDHGPDAWHRDIPPARLAPLRGLQEDMLANGPGYVQWNIPLYHDDVLWVVPGSHRRANTAAEDRQLTEDPRVPLPDSLQVKLQAGDGVVYSNLILHWPSNYSTKLRRVIHLGYRSFGGPLYPYDTHFYWNPRFTRHLSPAARATFERFSQLSAQEHDRIEALFRAILAKDASMFRANLEALHPGEVGRMVAVVLLSKKAASIRDLKRPEIASLPLNERATAAGDQRTSLYLLEDLAQRFSPAEADLLWTRFTPLDAQLQSATEQPKPGFQGGESRYADDEMPANFGIEELIASWA